MSNSKHLYETAEISDDRSYKKVKVLDGRLYKNGDYASSESSKSDRKEGTTWEKCIEKSDAKLAKQLLEQKILPNQVTINGACLKLGRKHEIVGIMCKAVCTFIENKQPQKIKRVWSSYKYVKNATIDFGSVNDVTFIIETQSDETLNMEGINMYKTYVRTPSEISLESKAIIQHEASTSPHRRKKMEAKRDEIEKCVDDNVEILFDKHTNITTVSPSLCKSKNFGQENEKLEDNLCIVVYVRVKGYIPLNEDPFVQKINSYDVDVRECVFTPEGSGPKDFHQILKTGLEIGITLNSDLNDQYSKFGTLGYLDPPNKPTHFVTCAHVVMDKDELARSHQQDTHIDIYQPLVNKSRKICGRAIKTVYEEKGGNGVGVDAALVEIVDRNSNGFAFPHTEKFKNLSLMAGIFKPNSDRNDVKLIKYGCASDVTHGQYPFLSRLGVVKEEGNGLTLRNQIAIIPTKECNTFSVGGDSGAVVFEKIGGKLYATCMVEGYMSDGRTVATPLIDVLVALKIRSPSDEQKLDDSERDECDMECL